MRAFFLNFDDKTPLYIQLYKLIKEDIINGDIVKGEKLPSLRNMANSLDVSITTIDLAYNQLLVEGYIISKPQSGFYVADILGSQAKDPNTSSEAISFHFDDYTFDNSSYIYDLSSFDFQKWKKTTSRVFSEYPHLLLSESDVQGEMPLRYEIAKYIFSSRGVKASPEQIVIGAGTQQLTGHLCRILKKMGIDYLCTEDPGYIPIQNIFRDHGFAIGKIPVNKDGIQLDKLPINIKSAVYVSPSNQFPTGAVMPVANRYKLIKWAEDNNSIILEDDYDSELRYFGKPVPALQGLTRGNSVVYLGSFSSTLFPAIKISYMVLPQDMINIFKEIKNDYTQTCSKTEQLALALFMEDGLYYTNIKKLRKLYSQKLSLTMSALQKYAAGFIEAINTQSGINLVIRVNSPYDSNTLCAKAKEIGLHVSTASPKDSGEIKTLIFYYNQIPIEHINEYVEKLSNVWKQ